MKKILIIPCFALIASVILFSCEKKKDSGVGPGFKEETGTGGNPFPNNPTVTGTSTNTNPATTSSFLQVGGNGWSNPTCASTSSVTLKGVNGMVEVTLNFFIPPPLGTYTYAVASAATQSLTCSMMVQNAPNQPAGTVWYAKSGIVSVNSTTASISAAFSLVDCYQQDFNFPKVTISGNLGCSN